MSDSPYDRVHQRILHFLQETDVKRDPSGQSPPALYTTSFIANAMPEYDESMDVAVALGQLHGMGILQCERSEENEYGTTIFYWGFHPAIVEIDGVYVVDPDLCCQRCGKLQTGDCVMGWCAS